MRRLGCVIHTEKHRMGLSNEAQYQDSRAGKRQCVTKPFNEGYREEAQLVLSLGGWAELGWQRKEECTLGREKS